MKEKYRIDIVLGIRPDIIRSSVILDKISRNNRFDLRFIYTGQHYDHNLMGVFFEEMDVVRPHVILDCGGGPHYNQHSRLIESLGKLIEEDRPDVCLFLGDANAVMGCIAPLKAGVPIAHVEGLQRSYDWTMPEERNRVVIDRVSDVLYAYHYDTKIRGVQEGICPTKILVVGNTIVDVIQHYGQKIKPLMACGRFNLSYKKYAVMTLHRDSNMRTDVAPIAIKRVYDWCKDKGMMCVLPVMPRLKSIIGNSLNDMEDVFIFTEPLSFFDFVSLEAGAAIEFTDSGTNQETSTILSVPCVVIRANTERPETFDSGIVAMKDLDIARAADEVFGKYPKKDYSLGDGKASDRIIEDLLSRLDRNFDKDLEPWHNKFIRRNWT